MMSAFVYLCNKLRVLSPHPTPITETYVYHLRVHGDTSRAAAGRLYDWT